MAKLAFLLLTALSVSLDSFFCGFALTLSARTKREEVGARFRVILLGCVLSAVTLLCSIAALLGNTLRESERIFALRFGGTILLVMGFLGLMKIAAADRNNRAIPPFLSLDTAGCGGAAFFSAGLGVGTDGAVAVFSLSAMGYGGILSAVTVIACHALLTDAGIKAAGLPKEGVLPRFRICAPAILILLSITRLM